VSCSWTLVGCVVDETGSGSSGGGYAGGGYGPSGGSTTSSSSGGGVQAMLVDVDPNRTMSANPGDGVGVFTEYESGGHWHVWWTCDTNKTSLPCAFDVTVSVTTGTIANLSGQTLERGDTVTQASPTQIEATTTTTSAVDGMTFDTVVPSGTTPIITLDAKLSGVEDASFLFFVQDGQINGNYSGSLTDPLMLEPTIP
jgi:hypothetical protein